MERRLEREEAKGFSRHQFTKAFKSQAKGQWRDAEGEFHNQIALQKAQFLIILWKRNRVKQDRRPLRLSSQEMTVACRGAWQWQERKVS